MRQKETARNRVSLDRKREILTKSELALLCGVWLRLWVMCSVPACWASTLAVPTLIDAGTSISLGRAQIEVPPSPVSYTTLNVSWDCDLHNCMAIGRGTWPLWKDKKDYAKYDLDDTAASVPDKYKGYSNKCQSMLSKDLQAGTKTWNSPERLGAQVCNKYDLWWN